MIGVASEVEYIESVIPPIVDKKAQTNHCENPQMLTSANEAATENNKGDLYEEFMKQLEKFHHILQNYIQRQVNIFDTT